MLCGGITVFSPLQKNGAGPGKRVGIVGIGGLGHFGLLYAKVRLNLSLYRHPLKCANIFCSEGRWQR